ncbi:ATP-binding protein [Roseofilum sp. BLCC_M154]|uniref:ATP-binding protein n=1 Tax=Roseofilum acuticapitatum BLCC-M154 TaxID=3022444 RepID=A0ABT7ATQ2_9CYAN|nr:ATP-binding protein [Roseofilum acuticapitatum]MDJ1170298.1 ATP-binding protein [Roseofilum acuticapitatum BLCC-M154]
MIILHDGTSGDLSHVQAMGSIEEGFALFDYVRLDQGDMSWIGQILEPNRNISIVNSNRLDPTILHGLRLMQDNPNVQSVESVQVFEIGILGQYNGRQLLTPRLRPLPGAVVSRLNVEDTSRVIGIPQRVNRDDGTSNVVGELLNAEGVPLCIDPLKFNYHIMVSGGTGSGKSNVSANLVEQALQFGKCVLLHDAKPDYGFIDRANTDPGVPTEIWEQFRSYGLVQHGISNVTRVGFHGLCDPNTVDAVVGFNASDFSPEILAGLFFPYSNEQAQFEGFAGAGDTLYQEVHSRDRQSYTTSDILDLVRQRMNKNVDPLLQIHEATGKAILRKANNRQKGMPWLDVVGQNTGKRNKKRLQSSLDGNWKQTVQSFTLEEYVEQGKILVINYAQMETRSYALILSYFLRICQQYCKKRNTDSVGIVQMVDEAHRVFDNDSQYSTSLERAFERVMREGRSVDHSIILSLQNTSQIPQRVMNNLNTKFVMRQNSKAEADAATQTMGREFSPQAMKLGTGQALVAIHESKATVLAQMAPSPFELMRTDNTGARINAQEPYLSAVTDEFDL